MLRLCLECGNTGNRLSPKTLVVPQLEFALVNPFSVPIAQSVSICRNGGSRASAPTVAAAVRVLSYCRGTEGRRRTEGEHEIVRVSVA